MYSVFLVVALYSAINPSVLFANSFPYFHFY